MAFFEFRLLILDPQSRRWDVLNLEPSQVRVAAPEELLRAASRHHPTCIFFIGGSEFARTRQAMDLVCRTPSLEFIPRVIVSDCELQRIEALKAGCHASTGTENLDELRQLAASMSRLDRRAAILDHETNLQLMLHSVTDAYDATIEGWVKALDLRDRETEEHSVRVAGLTRSLAKRFGFGEPELTQIYRGAVLHDIGKLGVPDSILQKTDALTAEERSAMQRHPEFAYEMLSKIGYLAQSIDIPYCHHERYDGKGYPNGLHGDDIPLTARLFSVIDVYDALRFDRPYRRGWEENKVIDYLRAESGLAFDPRVVDEFVAMLEEQILEASA
jgi:putative two-component system response regulator